jgi:hypothetical protein
MGAGMAWHGMAEPTVAFVNFASAGSDSDPPFLKTPKKCSICWIHHIGVDRCARLNITTSQTNKPWLRVQPRVAWAHTRLIARVSYTGSQVMLAYYSVRFGYNSC